MTFIKEVLRIVSKYPGGYSMIYDAIYENGKTGSETKEQVLRNTLSALKKKGLLEQKDAVWVITPEGKELLKNIKPSKKVFFSPERPLDSKSPTLLILFDIPENKRIYRDWLRNELIGFGYELIQKSAWFGPKLPKEFIEYLHDRDLLKYIKFFKAKKEDFI